MPSILRSLSLGILYHHTTELKVSSLLSLSLVWINIIIVLFNQVSDQKAAQSFEYRRFVMLFGSSRVYRSKKIWVEKKLCVYEVCGHALLTIVGKSQILHE